MSNPFDEIDLDDEVDLPDLDIKQDPFEADQRMRALASVYQTTLSILATERVRVLVEDNPYLNVAAYTNGLDITINSSQLDRLDFDEIVRVHGLVFHELCHVRYTPRVGTDLVREILAHGFNRSFNILEDQRIETLLTNKYRSTVPWLSAAIMRWVIADPSSLSSGMLYVHGRKFLPAEVRRLFDDHFGTGLTIPTYRLSVLKSRAKVIIDEYRALVFPTDYDRALELVKDFHDILTEVEEHGATPSCPHGHEHRGVLGNPSKGRPKGVSDQRKDRDAGNKIDDTLDDVDSVESQDPRDTDQDSEPEQTKSDASGQGSQPATNSDDRGTEPQAAAAPSTTNADDSNREQSDYVPSSTRPQAGTERGADEPIFDPEEQRAALDQIEDTLQDLLSQRDVRDEIRSAQQRLRGGNGNEILKRARVQSQWSFPPNQQFRASSRRLQDVLARLDAMADPGWVRQVDSGRVNAVRWFTDNDPETAYDRWEEGVNDATDLEVVLMLDVSGSMGWAAQESHQAMWAIKNALDTINAATTVITYDDECKILYSASERAGSIIKYAFTGGGTDPVEGLNQAARIFDTTKRANRVLITLTDGYWGHGHDEYGFTADGYIKKMRQSGVTTALGFIVSRDEAMRNPEWLRDCLTNPEINHGCDVVGVAGGQDLVPFIRRVVEMAIRQRLRAAA